MGRVSGPENRRRDRSLKPSLQGITSSPHLKQGKEAGTNDADRPPNKQGRDRSQERNRRHHEENAEAPFLRMSPFLRIGTDFQGQRDPNSCRVKKERENVETGKTKHD